MIKELYAEQSGDYEANSLIPFPGRESREQLLLFVNPTDSKIIYSMNVRGGLFLLGLNNLKRITSLELGIYRKNWTILNGDLSRPQPTINGCLEFVNIDSRINEFDELLLRTYTDKSQSAVKIEIGGDDRTNSLWVAISKYCLAELVENYLVGFWIDISDY